MRVCLCVRVCVCVCLLSDIKMSKRKTKKHENTICPISFPSSLRKMIYLFLVVVVIVAAVAVVVGHPQQFQILFCGVQ